MTLQVQLNTQNNLLVIVSYQVCIYYTNFNMYHVFSSKEQLTNGKKNLANKLDNSYLQLMLTSPNMLPEGTAS